MVRKGEKFNDPVIGETRRIRLDGRSLFIIILILSVGAMATFTIFGTPKEMKPDKSPDYISVVYNSDVLTVKYDGNSTYVTVDVFATRVSDEKIPLVSGVYYSKFQASFDFTDRGYVEYIVTVSERYEDRITYHHNWDIFKNAVGIIEMKYL